MPVEAMATLLAENARRAFCLGELAQTEQGSHK
jgi:hypothetical protein